VIHWIFVLVLAKLAHNITLSIPKYLIFRFLGHISKCLMKTTHVPLFIEGDPRQLMNNPLIKKNGGMQCMSQSPKSQSSVELKHQVFWNIFYSKSSNFEGVYVLVLGKPTQITVG